TETEATVHIEDVADVVETHKETESETFVNGDSSLVLSFMKKTDSNTVEVARNVKDGIESLQAELPDGVNLDVVIDTAEFIELSIDSVIQNILIGGAISVFILLLFLKSVRATLVIAFSIPIAIISTFALVYFTGETLNVLTLGGLALGIGMMVDSSIVILEHIYTYRQRGYSLMESATKGASELAPAVIASTTTTLVVFLPIIYVEGIASDLFTPLALAVSFSLITSLIVAVTLVPMLSSKLLSKAMSDDGRRYWFNRLLYKVASGYQRVLRWVLGHRKMTVAGTVVAIIASLALIPFIGAEFIPASDQGQMQITVETAPGSSLEHIQSITEDINDKLHDYEPLMETNFVSIGSGAEFDGDIGSADTATYMIQLIPAPDRDKTTDDIVKAIDDDLQDIPGADITVSSLEGSMDLGNPIQIQLNGPEHDVLRDLAEDVVAEIDAIDGVHNPESAASEGIPQMTINIDEEKAAAYGLDQQQIQSQIQLQFTGQTVTQYREEGHEMDVTLIYPEDERRTISDLQNMQIQSPSGATIPLEDVAELKHVQGPVSLLRQD